MFPGVLQCKWEMGMGSNQNQRNVVPSREMGLAEAGRACRKVVIRDCVSSRKMCLGEVGRGDVNHGNAIKLHGNVVKMYSFFEDYRLGRFG